MKIICGSSSLNRANRDCNLLKYSGHCIKVTLTVTITVKYSVKLLCMGEIRRRESYCEIIRYLYLDMHYILFCFLGDIVSGER